ITNPEGGLKKTEKITIVLFLIILFLVFRSLIAPFNPLLTVGISYLAVQGILAIFANKMNFPLSTYTHILFIIIIYYFITSIFIYNIVVIINKMYNMTFVLFLIILFLVFRSLIAPFNPLLTVGISYLAAQGIVAILANTMNFPLSTYTQIFMVVIMFGIGTDYCILIISRFKEELMNDNSVKKAVLKT